MALADAEYIALTTYRKDGTPKTTPVWPVDGGDGQIAFITASETWKVKRLANDERVRVQQSDIRGRVDPDTPSVSGAARVVRGEEFQAIEAKVRAKYGVKLTLINLLKPVQRLFGHSGPDNDCAVIITPDAA